MSTISRKSISSMVSKKTCLNSARSSAGFNSLLQEVFLQQWYPVGSYLPAILYHRCSPYPIPVLHGGSASGTTICKTVCIVLQTFIRPCALLLVCIFAMTPGRSHLHLLGVSLSQFVLLGPRWMWAVRLGSPCVDRIAIRRRTGYPVFIPFFFFF